MLQLLLLYGLGNILLYINISCQEITSMVSPDSGVLRFVEIKCSEEIAKLCKKVKDVVESKTHWGTSLEANIHSFKAGLDNEKELKELREDVKKLKSSNAARSSEHPKKSTGKKEAM